MAAQPTAAEQNDEPAESAGTGSSVQTADTPPPPESRMPAWLPRAMVMALALLGLFELANWAAHELIGIAIMMTVAFFISLAMEPAVDGMAARGVNRGLATAIVFIIVFACTVGFLVTLGILMVETVSTVLDELPRLLDELISWVNHTFHQNFTVGQLRDRLFKDSDVISSYAERAANNVWGLSNTVLGGFAKVVTIALFSVYMTADGPKLRRSVCSLLPPAKQGAVLHAWDLAIDKTGGYLYSRALLAVISALTHGVFLWILGIPNAFALGIWFGVIASFVPTIGTYIAGILPILVALTVEPIDAVWILIFVVVYQWIQDYVLQPRITARTVDVNPAVALLSVIVGGALLGAVGALLAIPATATLQAFLSEYVKRYEVNDDPRIERGGGKARKKR
ncbi:MAG: rane protein YrrI [Nocardia sp.]|uniref:AI-2E family transporter n=1 Tax=Nocardia sp. TaxID=1821 RepID=UPI0026313819|nr:AI-2E family transporter [Nocardia sp.]MCU1645684.1 rane protein YrrI [Nocardia sp.]